MKRSIGLLTFLVLILSILSACESRNNAPPTQLYEWTWISGSNTANQMGVYGTKGEADPSNVPGARAGAVSWVDHSGKFWLFGGFNTDTDGYLNDLWEFDPSTLEWTWVSGSDTPSQAGIYGSKGIASPLNAPGGRKGAISWADANGKLWLFGGTGYDSAGNRGDLNDLWSYDLAANEWTWISGSNVVNQPAVYGTKGTGDSSNVPGARAWAVSWIDQRGKLWIFGGFDWVAWGERNDLWSFDPTTLEWTWVSGSSSTYQPGTYGTKGQPSPLNVPGARRTAVSWKDLNGNFWLFGGFGEIAPSYGGNLNDLWKFDTTTSEWTWVSGSDTADHGGTYGSKGLASPLNVPGTRYSSAPWVDASGKLWFFGGSGFDSAGWGGFLNDLWMFYPITAEWTWVSGSKDINQAGIYGTKGTASNSTVPGARLASASWIDASGVLWLFGGSGLDSAMHGGDLNDLWKYSR